MKKISFLHPSKLMIKKSHLIAAVFFLVYTIVSSCKICIFNSLIVDSYWFQYGIYGIFNKLFLVIPLTILLTLPKRPFLFIVFFCLQFLYMFVNLSYHFSFEGYLHISQYFGLYSEALDLVKHAAVPHDNRLFLLLIDVPFCIGFLIVYSSFRTIKKAIRIRTSLYGIAILLFAFVYNWKPTNDTVTNFMNDAYSSDISVVKKHGLLMFNIVDFLNLKTARQYINKFVYGPEHTFTDTTEAHPNMLMIQVESLDAYIVDKSYKNIFVTPFLHNLTKTSVYYPYMLSYHEAGSTSDCEFSTINSVEALNDYPAMKLRNYNYENSVLKRLSPNGYNCIAFHGNRGTYFNRTAAFKKMGFNKFYDMFEMDLQEVNWGVSDKSVFDFTKSRLRLEKKPFFYYIITMSSHEPFTLTRPYYQNNTYSNIKNEQTKNYFNVMSYVDEQIKELVRSVRATHPNTYIFIYGDHTPIIPKDVYRRAAYFFENRLFEFVPLFIITPTSQVYTEKLCVSSFVDIAPTVLAKTGTRNSIRSNGYDLLGGQIPNTLLRYRTDLYYRSDLYKKIKQRK